MSQRVPALATAGENQPAPRQSHCTARSGDHEKASVRIIQCREEPRLPRRTADGGQPAHRGGGRCAASSGVCSEGLRAGSSQSRGLAQPRRTLRDQPAPGGASVPQALAIDERAGRIIPISRGPQQPRRTAKGPTGTPEAGRCPAGLWLSPRELWVDHPNVATDLNNLAQLLTEATGARATALSPGLWRLRRASGRIINVAAGLINLGELLRGPTGAEAEPLYRRALAISETSFRRIIPTTRRVSTASPTAGKTDRHRGRAAVPRARQSARRALGRNHPNVAASLDNSLPADGDQPAC
jgi:hypothetical protein